MHRRARGDRVLERSSSSRATTRSWAPRPSPSSSRPTARRAPAATVMTVELDDPGQYGRIVRDSDGGVERIVETKHPENVIPEILDTKEINTGTYLLPRRRPSPPRSSRITNDNEAGEYYLGDVLPAHARRRPQDRRLRRHRPQREPRREHPRRPRAGRGRGAPQASTSATCSPASPSPTPHRPGSTPASRSAQDTAIEPGTALRGDTQDRRGRHDRPAHDHPRLRDRRGLERPPLAPRPGDGRRRLHRRPLLLPAPRREPRRRLEGRHVRRDQELRDRRRREGPAPRLRRRRGRRRGRQRRRRIDHRELRRQGQAPHEDRGRCANRRSTTRSSRRWRSAKALTLAPVQ